MSLGLFICVGRMFLSIQMEKSCSSGAPELFSCCIVSFVTIFVVFFFFFYPVGVRSSVWVMLGYGAKQDAGAAAETPRTCPNSQEHAAHYPPLWLLLGEDS